MWRIKFSNEAKKSLKGYDKSNILIISERDDIVEFYKNII